MSGEQDQDSVSDVERLRAALQPFADEADAQERVTSFSSGNAGLPRTKLTIGDLRRARAALAVPINKIGEDARTYADGVEDAAKVAHEQATDIAARAPMGSLSESTAWAIVAAIRRLSTSTDKGVSNGR